MPDTEISATDKKLKTLEEEIKRIREPLEKTLLDIREMINSAENPFNFLSRINLEETATEQKTVSRSKAVSQEATPALSKQPEQVEVDKWSNMRGIHRFVNVLAGTNLMVTICGREFLLNLLNMLAWKNLISRELVEAVKEALEFLSTLDFTKVDNLPSTPITFQELLTVLYVLSLLSRDNSDQLTLLVLATKEGFAKILRAGSNWGGRQ
jgi:hypothetical protein